MSQFALASDTLQNKKYDRIPLVRLFLYVLRFPWNLPQDGKRHGFLRILGVFSWEKKRFGIFRLLNSTRMKWIMRMVTDKSCKNNHYESRCCFGPQFNSCVSLACRYRYKLEVCATILYASVFHPRQSVADKKSFHVRIGNGGAPKAQYHPSTKTPCVLCALARA